MIDVDTSAERVEWLAENVDAWLQDDLAVDVCNGLRALVAERDAERAKEARLRKALSEILEYRGDAESPLHDSYVMERAVAALQGTLLHARKN